MLLKHWFFVVVASSVVDRRCFDADPDSTFHFVAVPDPDQDSFTFYTRVRNENQKCVFLFFCHSLCVVYFLP